MKKELRITVNSDGKFEVKINGLSEAELIMAINELIISVKKVSEECGVSKHNKILNRHIQKAVDRALNGEHFTSEDEIAEEIFSDVFSKVLNDLKHLRKKSKCETEDEGEEEKTNDEKSILFTLPAGNSIVEYNNGASIFDLTSVLVCALCEVRELCIDGHLDALCESVIRLVRNVILDETDRDIEEGKKKDEE